MLAAALTVGLLIVRPRIAEKLRTPARYDLGSAASGALPRLQ